MFCIGMLNVDTMSVIDSDQIILLWICKKQVIGMRLFSLKLGLIKYNQTTHVMIGFQQSSYQNMLNLNILSFRSHFTGGPSLESSILKNLNISSLLIS